jgi:hypothetical protein
MSLLGDMPDIKSAQGRITLIETTYLYENCYKYTYLSIGYESCRKKYEEYFSGNVSYFVEDAL